MARHILGFTILALAALTGCPSPNDTLTGGAGGIDADAGCPQGPTALLNLHIKATNGPVPPDTELLVNWSAGEEPPFVLDDPSTWGKASGEGNVLCDVDHTKPPPTDLTELVCHLWTSGATHVEVKAKGYTPYEGTVKAKVSEACDGPVPTYVGVSLAPVAKDAG